MALHGRKLYLNAILAGGLGFVTFGWDAGVLGGILLTPAFQAAIGVGGDPTLVPKGFSQICTESNQRLADLHGDLHILTGIMVGMHDHNVLRHEHGEKNMDLGWQRH